MPGQPELPLEVDELVVPLEVVPLEVVPLEVVPLEVVPLEVVPLEVVPLEVVPLEVVPLEVVPLEVVPLDLPLLEVVPLEVVPLEEELVSPLDVEEVEVEPELLPDEVLELDGPPEEVEVLPTSATAGPPRPLKTLCSWVDTWLTTVSIVLPTTTTTIPMAATSKAYSTALAPEVFLQNMEAP